MFTDREHSTEYNPEVEAQIHKEARYMIPIVTAIITWSTVAIIYFGGI